MKYYRLIPNGNDKEGGLLYPPQEWPYPIARDAVEVENWQNLKVELKEGIFCPFHFCVGGANMISEELKNLFKSFIGENDNIEFLPVTAISKEYGNKQYYIMHFKIIYDVIDKGKTLYVPGTKYIIKVRIDQSKAKGLKVFNSQPSINDVIISEDVYQAIRHNKSLLSTKNRQAFFEMIEI